VLDLLLARKQRAFHLLEAHSVEANSVVHYSIIT